MSKRQPCGHEDVPGYGCMTEWLSSYGSDWIPKWRQYAGRTVCQMVGHQEDTDHPRCITCNLCWSQRDKVHTYPERALCKDNMDTVIGYVSCYKEKDGKHCRMPVGHEGECAYV